MKTMVAVLVAAMSVGSAQQLVIRGARVFDGNRALPKTVVIQGSRIEACGENVEIPAGAKVVDGTGMTLLPGFFDLHTHLLASAGRVSADWGKILKAYLLSGVTTVADLSTYPEQFEPMRRLITDGLAAPHVLMAARFSTPGGHGAEGGRADFHTQLVSTPNEARAAVRRILPYKPDVLKVFSDGWRYGMAADMTSMDEATLAALVDEAHKNGLKVVSHTVTLERTKIAARAGVDVIDHGTGDALLDREALELLKSRGIGYAGTLAVYEPRPGRDLSTPLLAQLLEPAMRAELRAAPDKEPPSAQSARWRNLTTNAKALRDAGILQGVGTDAGMGGTYHGWSTLHEMELLVKSGLTPAEAIAAGTSTSARLLGLDKDRGAIAPGMRADLVMVAGDPLTNIRDLYNVRAVWLDGNAADLPGLRDAVASSGMTPIRATPAAPHSDDFEASNQRSAIDTLWVNSTDAGHDHSKMAFQRTSRPGGGHALTTLCQFSAKPTATCGVVLPLSKGSVLPVDISRYQGIEFEVRGDGAYVLQVPAREVREGAQWRAEFQAAPAWKTVRIPFSRLERRGDKPAWTGKDALNLEFLMINKPGAGTWLELDNVGFY